MQYARINKFSGLHLVTDSPNAPMDSLKKAENVLLRPAGAIQRMPVFKKLWRIEDGLAPLLIAAGHNTPASGTMIVKITANTMTVLVAAQITFGNVTGQGVFFVGDSNGKVANSPVSSVDTLDDVLADLSNPFGSTANPVVTVLATNLALNKRVYFSRVYDEIWIGNGVDANRIYRPSDGTLRIAGTNETPSKPLVGSIASLPAVGSTQPSVSVVTAGTTVLTVGTTTTTTGTSTLVFTADPINFSGTAGHNISVRIIPSGSSTAISSTRTGAGTTPSPFIYTLTLGTTAEQSSADAIVSFVNNDYNATGVLTAAVTTLGPDANPNLTLALTPLAGGADEVTVGGHPTTMRCTFATTLFDPGPPGSNLGYEGPASALSNEVIGTGSNDFMVTVQQKSGVDARFSKQNIWMLQYVGPPYPISPDGPFVWRKIMTVNNANGSYRIKKDFQSLEVRDSAPDQGRIPPCTMFEFAGDKMWASGNAGEPYRIWLSKTKTDTEQVPEGCDITSYIDIEGRKEEPARPRITAMNKLESRIQVHTDRSITVVEASTMRRIVSRTDVGCMNPSCLANWARPDIPYLGADGIMYELNNTQYYRSGNATPKAWPAMKEKLLMTTLAADPNKATLIADNTNEMIVICAPVNMGVLSQAMGCFVFDTQSGALTGPCVAPGFVSACSTGAVDNRFVGISPSGYLYVLSLSALHNIDSYTSSGSLTRYSVFDNVSNADKGMPIVQLDSLGNVSYSGLFQYRRAYLTQIETQLLDFQTPNERKGFYSLEWSSVPASICILKIVLETDNNQSKTINLGQITGKSRYKVAFALSGNAIRIRLEAIYAEDKPFLIRDLTIGYELQTNAGGFFF